MLKSFLLIVLFSLSMALSAQSIKATFVQINVVQLDPITEDVIDSWETRNYCTYSVNSKRTKMSFKEFSPGGTIVREWEHPIIGHSEDDEVDSFMLNQKDGTITVKLWKDKSMVALEGADAVYLVAGLLNSTSD